MVSWRAVARANPLWRNEFVELEVSYADKIVLVRRTAAPFARLGDIETTTEALARVLPSERRKQHAVLIDMRLAPVRTDASLEPAFERYRREVERGFERAVVVVTTVVGRLRSERLGAAVQIPLTIVGSIEEAWMLLRDPPAAS
jgi:hypothetical protein